MCLALTYFDHDKYVAACNSLSAFWYVWRPSWQDEVCVTARLPLYQSSEDAQKLSELFDWASRTDPDRVIRSGWIKFAWDNRLPGQEIVVIQPCKEKVDTACAA